MPYKMTMLLVFSLVVFQPSTAYVLYQQSFIPIVTQEVNPYAVAQHTDIVRKLEQLFSCPFCCPVCEDHLKRDDEDEEDDIEEVVYSPIEEELTVLNVMPLRTTEKPKPTNEDMAELERKNQIVKEFLEDRGTVKKENPGGSSNGTVVSG